MRVCMCVVFLPLVIKYAAETHARAKTLVRTERFKRERTFAVIFIFITSGLVWSDFGQARKNVSERRRPFVPSVPMPNG